MSPQAEYVRSVAVWMTLYVILIVVISWTPLGEQLLAGPLVYPVAALPALPIIMVMLAMLRLMRRSDEFVRALLAKRFVVAVALDFAGCAVWGFLESFAKAPHAPLWMVFPAFWFCFGIISPFVKDSR